MGRGAKEMFPEGRHTSWLEFIKSQCPWSSNKGKWKPWPATISSEKENKGDSQMKASVGENLEKRE